MLKVTLLLIIFICATIAMTEHASLARNQPPMVGAFLVPSQTVKASSSSFLDLRTTAEKPGGIGRTTARSPSAVKDAHLPRPLEGEGGRNRPANAADALGLVPSQVAGTRRHRDDRNGRSSTACAYEVHRGDENEQAAIMADDPAVGAVDAAMSPGGPVDAVANLNSEQANKESSSTAASRKAQKNREKRRRYRANKAKRKALECASNDGVSQGQEGRDDMAFKPNDDANNEVAVVINGDSLGKGRNRERKGSSDDGEGCSKGVVEKKKSQKRKKKRMVRFGNLPDVHWRAIPMEHLRTHPSFEPLPHPDTIDKLDCLEDVRNFRQDSWQWEALHSGRCTTSQAASALGLLEPEAARALGIPRTLQKGGLGAYFRLGEEALRNLGDMNRVLCTGGNNSIDGRLGEGNNGSLWKAGNHRVASNRTYAFAAKYLPRMMERELEVRKKRARRYFSQMTSPLSVRMSWGNAQEATALLTGLNYFWNKDPRIIVKEVGMCGADLATNSTECNSLLIGASPDVVIQYPDGSLEALEVKNHCPFVPAKWLRRRRKEDATNSAFGIREMPLQSTVPPGYIPQLMMEMLSLGPQCRSAVMVRQTATTGAVILRLHRDDEWIEEMMYWLNRFNTDFVQTQIHPPENFFWDDSSSARYRMFVRRTKELGESVQLVDYVKHGEIQRVLPASPSELPLFLD